MLQLVVCAINYNGQFAIGKNGDLLVKLKDDFSFLKTLTSESLDKNSKLDANVVIMGRNTYFSIPKEYRHLKNRINLVLTRDPYLLKSFSMPRNFCLKKEKTYFISYESFWKMYYKKTPNVFVLGGKDIYNYFMERCDKLYITHVVPKVKLPPQDKDIVTINCPSNYFKLVSCSSTYQYNNGYYNILYYRKTKQQSEEGKYLDFMEKILNGVDRNDRTTIGTLSNFGNYLEFDVSNTIPLLTTKFISFKNIIEELLWFCRGDTDASILQNKGVRIWDHNTSREFLDSQNLHHYPEGILGPGYGFQWRFFGAEYNMNKSLIKGGFDQIKYIEHLLQNDPFSRRIVLSAWNPPDFSKTALVPCHILLQFYVEEVNSQKYLSLLFYMRSNDVFLAINYNIVSYTVLLYIFCVKCNMLPKKIVYMSGDAHIYTNHIVQTRELLCKPMRPFPKLIIDNSVSNKDWKDLVFSDFNLVGYFPNKSISAKLN